MQNYHKHSYYSNLFSMDSIASYEDYAKRCIELGHKVLCSVEHGWQCQYFVPYSVAKKYNLKFVFGTEAYWVKDRFEKERTANHIVVLAKNENGRQAINDILSEANITGYYYRPRVDIELLLSLPPNDVMICTACVAYWHYDDIEDITLKLFNHFKNNFYLEIQNHNTEKQINLNQRIKSLSYKYNIPMIAGLDSHYIYPKDAEIRTAALESKGIRYEDEDGWYMDYPSDEECFARFQAQGVFTNREIQQAMDNTDVLLTFEDYDDLKIFKKEIKLPTIYPDKTQEEKNKIFSRLITKQFKEYIKHIPPEQYNEYHSAVLSEVNVWRDTGMVDYPLINYEVIKRGVELGGVITKSGRGSAVSFITNMLLGFSNVDRLKSTIPLYPDRFMSTSRILDTKSLPDIDFNEAETAPFEQAQKEILGEEHSYPMIAFGTFKKKSAFKLYARSKDMPATLANEISKQIDRYETDLKYADDEDKKYMNIYDYVDEQYHPLIKESEKYWGIVADRKKAPSAHLLYQGNIRKEIGLIKCKSESSKKEYITAVIDGAVAEEYKFLKNDNLVVNVVDLVDKIFKRIGKPHMSSNELLAAVKDNDAVWDIYAKGLTIGVNQCEKASTTQKAMRYKPKNEAELASFIAAIRPGFKSMYPIFESREPFSYGVPTLDNLLSTEQMPIPFMIFQEQVMMVLNYAGFPMDQCYGLIKAISKKKVEKVKAIKDEFITNFARKIQNDDNLATSVAEEMAHRVWQIVDDNSNYSFNSSHRYCMAIDSLYCAYLKATYPYEFYEVLLQYFSNKGNKEKVALLKKEMYQGFGIREGRIKFGTDNTRIKADPENNSINTALLSIKNMNQKSSVELLQLSKSKKYNKDDFYYVLNDIKTQTGVQADQIDILRALGYFSDFADVPKIQQYIKIYRELYERTQFTKSKVSEEYLPYIIEFSTQTDKLYKNFDYESALLKIWSDLEDVPQRLSDKIKAEYKYLGYITTTVPHLDNDYGVVLEIKPGDKKGTYTIYNIKTGDTEEYKIRNTLLTNLEFEINIGDIIKIKNTKQEKKWRRNNNGEFYRSDEIETFITNLNLMR